MHDIIPSSSMQFHVVPCARVCRPIALQHTYEYKVSRSLTMVVCAMHGSLDKEFLMRIKVSPEHVSFELLVIQMLNGLAWSDLLDAPSSLCAHLYDQRGFGVCTGQV